MMFTTAYMGWGGIQNGELLARAAAAGFDAFVTVDAGIEFEQNLSALPCAVVIIRAESNAFEHLQPHLPELLKALGTLKAKSIVRIG